MRKVSGYVFCLTVAAICTIRAINGFVPSMGTFHGRLSTPLHSTTEEQKTTINKNVAQTKDTNREEIMTFSYDMSLEPKYEKPTYHSKVGSPRKENKAAGLMELTEKVWRIIL